MFQKILLSLSYIFIFNLGFGQANKKETLSNQGSSHFVYANNKSYFIQESIGQSSVTFVYNAGNYSLRQGFLQPISPSGLQGDSDNDLDGYFYPNPFENFVHIRFNEAIFDTLEVSLFDALGRTVYYETYEPIQELNLDFGSVSSGNYVLIVKMRSKTLLAKLIRR